MLTLAVTSLSGGQGKTTTALFLGRKLAEMVYTTLIIDADPQHNQTVYLGLEIEERDPTLLEFLKKSVDFEETIYNTKYNENLFCIPADESLDNAVDYLSSSGVFPYPYRTHDRVEDTALRNRKPNCLIEMLEHSSNVQ